MNPSLLSSTPALVSLRAGTDLTFGTVLDSLPTDPASLFAIALLLGFFGLIAWAGLKGSRGEDEARSGSDGPAEPPEHSRSDNRTNSKIGR